MKKKLPLIIGIVVIIIAIVVVIVIAGNAKKDEEQNGGQESQQSVELNLTEVASKIEENSIFAEMATEEVTTETLGSFFKVDTSKVSNVVGKVPLMNIQASMYVIVEANDSASAEEVKTELETYGEAFEGQWKTYLPEQCDYVKNRKIGVKGKYAYLIIAENSDELEKLVK